MLALPGPARKRARTARLAAAPPQRPAAVRFRAPPSCEQAARDAEVKQAGPRVEPTGLASAGRLHPPPGEQAPPSWHAFAAPCASVAPQDTTVPAGEAGRSRPAAALPSAQPATQVVAPVAEHECRAAALPGAPLVAQAGCGLGHAAEQHDCLAAVRPSAPGDPRPAAGPSILPAGAPHAAGAAVAALVPEAARSTVPANEAGAVLAAMPAPVLEAAPSRVTAGMLDAALSALRAPVQPAALRPAAPSSCGRVPCAPEPACAEGPSASGPHSATHGALAAVPAAAWLAAEPQQPKPQHGLNDGPAARWDSYCPLTAAPAATRPPAERGRDLDREPAAREVVLDGLSGDEPPLSWRRGAAAPVKRARTGHVGASRAAALPSWRHASPVETQACTQARKGTREGGATQACTQSREDAACAALRRAGVGAHDRVPTWREATLGCATRGPCDLPRSEGGGGGEAHEEAEAVGGGTRALLSDTWHRAADSEHERVPTWREATLGGGTRVSLYDSSDDDGDGEWLPGAERSEHEGEEDEDSDVQRRGMARTAAKATAKAAAQRRAAAARESAPEIPRQGEALAGRLSELTAMEDQRCAHY